MKQQIIQALAEGRIQAQTASANIQRQKHERQGRLGGQQQEKYLIINNTRY